MNDFTKKELQHLMKIFCIAVEDKLISRIYELHHLEKKLQSMIDNYCDHKGARPGVRQYTSFECPKCGKDNV